MPKVVAKFQQLRMFHIFLFLVVFLLLWRIPYYGKLVLDDPFITFRYAQHLAHQGQFTFNLNQYVLATTTPVYGLLMTIIEVLHISIVPASTIINLLFEIGILYVLGRLMWQVELPYISLGYCLAGLLFITNRAMSIASNSGMETPLFVLLIFTCLYFVTLRHYGRASAVGAIATLTRPDGIFVLIIVAVVVVWRERRLPFREIAIALVIGLPWVIVAYLTYGTFIPQSVLAKSAIVKLWYGTFGYKLRVVFYEPLRWFGVILVPLVIWAAYELFRKANRLFTLTILAFTALQLAYLVLPGNLGFEWYFAPLYTSLDLLAALGAIYLLSRTAWLKRLGMVSIVGLLGGILYSSVGNYQSVAQIDRIWRDGMFRVVDYLNAHAESDTVVQSTNIGIIGYDTAFDILDPLGLASPEATQLMSQAVDLADLSRRVAHELKPDYVVSFGLETYDGYQQIAAFETETIPLIIYQRVAS